MYMKAASVLLDEVVAIGYATVKRKDLTPNDTLSISVKVKNTGQYKGTEVVQLYVSDLFGSVTRQIGRAHV